MSKLLLVTFFLCRINQTFQYEMDAITRRPGASQMFKSKEEIRKEIIDFEQERSLSLRTIEGKLDYSNVRSLCQFLQTDILLSLKGKKIFYFVPVIPIQQKDLPKYRDTCFSWIRKPCVGTPKPPFDYRCHFWIPYDDNSRCEATEGFGDNDMGASQVKYDSIVVNGQEAVTLCATYQQLDEGGGGSNPVVLDSIALPTNEATKLRCVNFRLSLYGEWATHRLSDEACAALNLRRPAGYLMNEFNKGLIEHLFGETVNCFSRDRLVDCVFRKNNVEENDAVN